jgi:hypothetical protein
MAAFRSKSIGGKLGKLSRGSIRSRISMGLGDGTEDSAVVFIYGLDLLDDGHMSGAFRDTDGGDWCREATCDGLAYRRGTWLGLSSLSSSKESLLLLLCTAV